MDNNLNTHRLSGIFMLSGIYGVPRDKVATAMVEALTECVHKYENPRTYKKPIEIHLVDMNTSMLQHIKSAFKAVTQQIMTPMATAYINDVLQRVLRTTGTIEGNSTDTLESPQGSTTEFHGNPSNRHQEAEEVDEVTRPGQQREPWSQKHSHVTAGGKSESRPLKLGSKINTEGRNDVQWSKSDSQSHLCHNSAQQAECMNHKHEIASVHPRNTTVLKSTQNQDKHPKAVVSGNEDGFTGMASDDRSTGPEHKQDSSVGAVARGRKSTDSCPICLGHCTDQVVLKNCKHAFCQECIVEWFKQKKTCPVCSKLYGRVTGNQPPGTMTHTKLPHQYSLPGYSNCGVIEITYSFPGGVQGVRTKIHLRYSSYKNIVSKNTKFYVFIKN